jgi:hypothetical protein
VAWRFITPFKGIDRRTFLSPVTSNAMQNLVVLGFGMGISAAEKMRVLAGLFHAVHDASTTRF